MFYEYAVEPTVICDWASARFFIDAFGPWKGRFIAAYPKRWRKMVFEALECADVEKHRVIEKLSRMDKRVFSRRAGGAYEPTEGWLSNAKREHLRHPFRAILASSENAPPHVLQAKDVDDDEPLWQTDTDSTVDREPAAFADALGLLLRLSTRVMVVDPYFRADQAEKMQTIAALRAASGTCRFEVHATDQISYAAFKRCAERAAADQIGAGAAVAFHCWSSESSSIRVHNRYVLTDIGGVQFGDSVERGSKGHTDRLSILSERLRADYMADYDESSSSLVPAGAPFVVHGTNPRER